MAFISKFPVELFSSYITPLTPVEYGYAVEGALVFASLGDYSKLLSTAFIEFLRLVEAVYSAESVYSQLASVYTYAPAVSREQGIIVIITDTTGKTVEEIVYVIKTATETATAVEQSVAATEHTFVLTDYGYSKERADYILSRRIPQPVPGYPITALMHNTVVLALQIMYELMSKIRKYNGSISVAKSAESGTIIPSTVPDRASAGGEAHLTVYIEVGDGGTGSEQSSLSVSV